MRQGHALDHSSPCTTVTLLRRMAVTKHKITIVAALMFTAGSASACGSGASSATMNPAFVHRLNHVCTADYAVMINTSKTPFPYPGFKPMTRSPISCRRSVSSSPPTSRSGSGCPVSWELSVSHPPIRPPGMTCASWKPAKTPTAASPCGAIRRRSYIHRDLPRGPRHLPEDSRRREEGRPACQFTLPESLLAKNRRCS